MPDVLEVMERMRAPLNQSMVRAALRVSTSSLRRVVPFALNLTAFLICIALTASYARAAGVWTKQKSGTLAWLSAVYFLDQQRGWAVGSSGALLTTADGGQNWKTLRPPTEDNVRDLYFSDEQNGWLVCERSMFLLKTKDEQRSYLLKTMDGGAVWRRINLNGDPDARILRALFTTNRNGSVFGEGGMIFSTIDGGATWVKKRAPTRHILFGGAFLDPLQLWLVGSGATIIQTKDGGQTWRTGNILGITTSVRFTAASFVDKARGWAVGNDGSIFMTVDGGRTWQAQPSPVREDLNDVKFVDAAEGWAVGAGGSLIHTTDGGFHWTIEKTGTTHPLERLFFIDRERGWAVGFGGTILVYGSAASNEPPVLRRAPALKGTRLN